MLGIITSSTTRSKSLSREALERLGAAGRAHDLVAVLAQRVGEQRQDRLLVVDEQDACRSLGHRPLPRQVGRSRVAGASTDAGHRAASRGRVRRAPAVRDGS